MLSNCDVSLNNQEKKILYFVYFNNKFYQKSEGRGRMYLILDVLL